MKLFASGWRRFLFVSQVTDNLYPCSQLLFCYTIIWADCQLRIGMTRWRCSLRTEQNDIYSFIYKKVVTLLPLDMNVMNVKTECNENACKEAQSPVEDRNRQDRKEDRHLTHSSFLAFPTAVRPFWQPGGACTRARAMNSATKSFPSRTAWLRADMDYQLECCGTQE